MSEEAWRAGIRLGKDEKAPAWVGGCELRHPQRQDLMEQGRSDDHREGEGGQSAQTYSRSQGVGREGRGQR